MPPPFGPRPPMTAGGMLPPRPALPGNPAGGPTGPGSSPALSPGEGAGKEAAADAQVKFAIESLHKALLALRALTANFGKEQDGAMAPAVATQMAQAAKGGGIGGAAPPPGITPRPGIGAPTMAPMEMPGGGA